MNFFEIVDEHIQNLTSNERKLFDYLVTNMNDVKNMSIRETSAKCFVSTATFLRFVRKIGFSGYSELITVLKYTTRQGASVESEQSDQFVVEQSDYREEYLKNIAETVHVIRPEVLHQLTAKLAHIETLFIFATGTSKSAAQYIANLYRLSGFNVNFPEDRLYRRAAIKHISATDLVLVIDYSGERTEFIELISTLLEQSDHRALILSITRADNNPVQNLSDVNLYTFVDEVQTTQGLEIGSRVAAIVIMELLLYQWLEDQQ